MDYNSFFGFTESPFLDVPDLRFLFLTQKLEAFLAELTEFVSTRQGIAVVSGDDGVGKTMLMQALIQRLPQSFQTLILTKPAAEPLAITLLIARSLGFNLGERTLINITPLADAIRTAAQQQQYFLLIMEDAHLLTDQNLEEIYILSQLEHQGQQLMPIILVGRKGLVPKVTSKTNQRLHDLIRKNIFLSNLTFEETPLYIDHRLQQVGSNFKERFAEGCHGQIFSRTSGVPRRINQMCDQALNRAWQENRSRVTRDLLGGEGQQPIPYKPLEPPSKWKSLNTVISMIAGVLLAGLAVFILYNNYVTVPSNPPLIPTTAPAVPEKAPVVPLQQESTPTPATVPQPQPPAQTAEQATPKPELSPAAPQAPPEPAETGPSPMAAVTPVPKAVEPPAEPEPSEPESAKATTYQVAPEDGLLKIVSTYYPDDKDIGYDAVILANPRINNEDFIYPGQTLTLPKVNKSNNIISIGSDEYFKIYGLYYNSSDVTGAIAKLKELQLHFVVRETEIPGEGKIYRVFLGSYGNADELKKAMALLGKN